MNAMKLNIGKLIAAAAVLAAGSAIADDTYPYVDHSKFSGARARAEVQAELRSGGALASRQMEFSDHARLASGRTRAEVRAELGRAYADGSYSYNRAPEFVDFTRLASSGSAGQARTASIRSAAGNAGG
ncbi:MAG: hypothetical protein ABWY05_07020 [Noviherbaspirillum sp.]